MQKIRKKTNGLILKKKKLNQSDRQKDRYIGKQTERLTKTSKLPLKM